MLDFNFQTLQRLAKQSVTVITKASITLVCVTEQDV